MLDAIPPTVAAIVAVIALGFLLRKAPEAPAAASTPQPRPARRPDRRAFLGWVGGAAALGALGAVAGTLLQSGARAATAVRDTFILPRAAVAAPPIPAGAELGITGLATVITPNKEFYRIDTALQIPRIDPATWSDGRGDVGAGQVDHRGHFSRETPV